MIMDTDNSKKKSKKYATMFVKFKNNDNSIFKAFCNVKRQQASSIILPLILFKREQRNINPCRFFAVGKLLNRYISASLGVPERIA